MIVHNLPHQPEAGGGHGDRNHGCHHAHHTFIPVALECAPGGSNRKSHGHEITLQTICGLFIDPGWSSTPQNNARGADTDSQ